MIVTADDIRDVRPIAENVNDSKRLVPYIDECEKLFLIPAIGAKKYLEIETSIKDGTLLDENSNLLNGCYYNDDTLRCEGLKKAMGYLVYSRFVRNQNVNATAFGIVTKQGQFSETVDEKTIVRAANDAEKIGLEYLKQCVAFLNFGENCSNQKVYKSRSKFKAIGD